MQAHIYNNITFDYKQFRKLFGIKTVTEAQVKSVAAILQECVNHAVTLRTQVAYILATAWHESYLKPIKEMGSESYLKGKQYYPFIGRGFVQLTWDFNYKKQGERLGIDLIKNPDKALEIGVAANILVHGMKYGEFTGKKLSDYITSAKTDFPNARRIVNYTDKAEMIAGHAMKMTKCVN